MFRDLTDIYDSWSSVIGMIGYFGDDPGNFSQVAGPGAWNDPDQVPVDQRIALIVLSVKYTCNIP